MALSQGQVKVYMLNTGKQLFSTALAGISVVNATYFSVGDSANFTGDPTLVAPLGANVFSGSADLISVTLIAPDTVRYTMTMPEDVGPFQVGNIMLYGSLPNNILTPLLHVVFPFKYDKTTSATTTLLPNGLPTPGSRLVINVSVRHVFDSDNFEVYVEFPDFANLPSFDSETSIPSGEINPWNAFLINRSVNTGSPVFGARNLLDNTQWGMPLWNRLTDPQFNVITGGVSGDGYIPDRLDYVSGGHYLTNEINFKGFAGGSTYTTAEEDFFDSVGGAPYTPIV